jgi:DNA-binding transcriptional LysR family regulator
MKLNLRQIEVFRAIMLSGSISGASKLLFVSQPAVSRLISYTEQRLGLQLFERVKGRLYPTPEAHRLYEEVGAVYQSVQRVNEVAEHLVENRIGKLRVACSPSLGQSLLPRAIGIFSRRYPDVRIVLQTLLPSIMLQALLTRQVELGVLYLPLAHPSLTARPIRQNPIVAVVPSTHHLASRKKIFLDDLDGEPLIGYSGDVPLNQVIREIFGSEDALPTPKIEVQQAHVACAMVHAGLGIALVDEITTCGPVWSNVVVRPLDTTAAATITICHPALEPLSRLAQEFISIVESIDLSREK